MRNSKQFCSIGLAPSPIKCFVFCISFSVHYRKVFFLYLPIFDKKINKLICIQNWRLARWRKWKSCDVGEAKEGLENELWRRGSDGKLGEWAELILQAFRHFTYVTAHSPTLPSLYLHHSSFSNPCVASPTSQLILQPFRCFTYVTAHSPILLSLLLLHRIFTYVTWRVAHGIHRNEKYWSYLTDITDSIYPFLPVFLL